MYVEATDGNLSSWQTIYNLCTAGFATNTDYNRLQGRDATGKRVNGKPVYVDIDNLIDYMLIIFYTGNFDAPTSSFGLNKGCNNYYAIRNRRNSSRGFVFFVHDAEHTLMAESISPGVGLYENRVSLGTRQDAYKMEMDGFHHFHPQWLHYRLSVNADYRMRFADRAFRLLQPGNPLSPEVCLSRFNRRTAEIEAAVVAESARWGDTDRPFAYTRDDAWMNEINEVRNDFIPYRSDILLNQLRETGLYPAIDPPVIQASSAEIHTSWYESEQGTTLSISRPGQSGTIYYTFDNSDPRSPNGQINPAAQHSQQTVTLPLTSTTPVKARIYLNGTWSALNHINFLGNSDDYSSLKVTELMYNPPVHIQSGDTLQSSSLEFIEFRNTGDSFLNLSGFHLDSAVQATFPENTILGPGSFLVAASKPYAFSSLYGVEPTVNYSGNFDNSGEEVLLTNPAGIPVISFVYDDSSPGRRCPTDKATPSLPLRLFPMVIRVMPFIGAPPHWCMAVLFPMIPGNPPISRKHSPCCFPCIQTRPHPGWWLKSTGRKRNPPHPCNSSTPMDTVCMLKPSPGKPKSTLPETDWQQGCISSSCAPGIPSSHEKLLSRRENNFRVMQS